MKQHTAFAWRLRRPALSHESASEMNPSYAAGLALHAPPLPGSPRPRRHDGFRRRNLRSDQKGRCSQHIMRHSHRKYIFGRAVPAATPCMFCYRRQGRMRNPQPCCRPGRHLSLGVCSPTHSPQRSWWCHRPHICGGYRLLAAIFRCVYQRLSTALQW